MEFSDIFIPYVSVVSMNVLFLLILWKIYED